MINDMIPWVDNNFRTLADQAHRAMSGLSMGAMCTKSVTLAHLDKFAYIGLFSGGTIAPAEITDKSKVKLVFMSYGSRERGSEGVKNAADVLQQAGIKSVSYVSPLTAHEWQSWRRSLREFAPLFLRIESDYRYQFSVNKSIRIFSNAFLLRILPSYSKKEHPEQHIFSWLLDLYLRQFPVFPIL